MADDWWTYTLDTFSIRVEATLMGPTPGSIALWAGAPSIILSSNKSEVTASIFFLFCLFFVIIDFLAAYIRNLSASIQVSSDQVLYVEQVDNLEQEEHFKQLW